MKLLRTLFVILLCLTGFAAVSGEDGFHSEFGYLPPEIPEDSGLTAGMLNELANRVNDESLPPSHRLRRVYEYMLSKVQFDPEIVWSGDQQDLEAVSAELTGIIQSSEAGDHGFALLSHYLLEKIGFPSVIISGEIDLPDGESEEHFWNYVFYADRWYHFDPLGEIRVPEMNGFMNIREELSGKPLHWDESAVPESAQYPVRLFGCNCKEFEF